MGSLVRLEWEDMKQINSESKVEGMNSSEILVQERTNLNKPMQSECRNVLWTVFLDSFDM